MAITVTVTSITSPTAPASPGSPPHAKSNPSYPAPAKPTGSPTTGTMSFTCDDPAACALIKNGAHYTVDGFTEAPAPVPAPVPTPDL